MNILTGGAVGFFNGFFGGGGGMLAVPAMEKLRRLPTKEAHSTALAVMLPLSLLSLAIYFFTGKINVVDALPCALGVFSGGIVGSRLMICMKPETLETAFVAVMAAAGVNLLFF